MNALLMGLTCFANAYTLALLATLGLAMLWVNVTEFCISFNTLTDISRYISIAFGAYIFHELYGLLKAQYGMDPPAEQFLRWFAVIVAIIVAILYYLAKQEDVY